MSETLTELRNGDIFDWWHRDSGLRSYRSYSHRAVVTNGRLCDTYWSTDATVLDPEAVELAYLGNVSEMTIIRPYERAYYRAEDVVDMRHANNSRAPVYVRPGAKRDAETMTTAVDSRIEDQRSAIRHAEWLITELEKTRTLINDGRLDDVALILSRV